MVCDRTILTNYNLVGDNMVNKSVNYLCPNVKNNCCSMDDQRKIYHWATKTIVNKYNAYNFRMKELLKEVRILH